METEPTTTQYESSEKDSQPASTSQEEKNRGNVPKSSPSARVSHPVLHGSPHILTVISVQGTGSIPQSSLARYTRCRHHVIGVVSHSLER